jgi:hypothetical protein
MTDKNSQEWKDYCEGLSELDREATSSIYAVPSPPASDVTYDMTGYFQYVKEKHNGDSSTMTQEEKDQFIIKKDHRKTA